MDAAGEFVYILALIVGGAIAAFAIYRVLTKKMLRIKRTSALADSTFRAIAAVIDQSVTGYKNRNVTKLDDTVNWGCSSRLFSFDVSLQQIDPKYVLSLYLRYPLPYDFRLKPPDSLPVDPSVQAILDAPDVRGLTEGLDFFDWIVVHKGGITARLDLTRQMEASRWKRALSAATTLLRYLIHVQQMANIIGSSISGCPYCREEIKQDEPKVRCSECNTLHHRDCWFEAGHCSVFGCNGKSVLPAP